MPDEAIRVEQVRVKDLPALADQLIDGAEPGAYIAITKQRARALALNPLADPDDVGLLVAWQGEQLAGYFGIMTISLLAHGQRHKVYWFTTWSVSPHLRGAGIGSLLMEEALKLEHDYMIVGSKPARRVCQKYGFDQLEPLILARLDFAVLRRSNPVIAVLRLARKIANLLGGKLDITESSKRAADWFERNFGEPFRRNAIRRELRHAGSLPEGVMVEDVSAVQPYDAHKPPVRLYRDAAVINWMLAEPWVALPGQSPSEKLDYYFTDTRPGFAYHAQQVTLDGAYNGYIVYQTSQIGGQRVGRVLDVALADERWVLPLALRFAQAHDLEYIEMNASYAAPLKGTNMYLARERIYQVHPHSADSPLAKHWRELALDFADGDMAFT